MGRVLRCIGRVDSLDDTLIAESVMGALGRARARRIGRADTVTREADFRA